MEAPPIVLDGGTGFIKVGYAGQDAPEFVFPSIVGQPTLRIEELRNNDLVIKDVMCGDEAEAAQSMLDIHYPMANGVIKDWGLMEALWSYTFYEKLRVNTEGRRILLTEPPLNPLQNRYEMCRMMFDKFGFGGVFVMPQAVLALYAQGIIHGIALDSGDGVTHIVPVAEGMIEKRLIRRLDVAGRDVTDKLVKLLQHRGYTFQTEKQGDMETVRQIKEKLCYVSYDLELDKRLSEETTVLVENYTLPDGRVIRLGSERFEAPECLFQPRLATVERKKEQDGVAELVFNTIRSCQRDLQKRLFKNIVLSGGSTMFPGFSSRLEKELKQQLLVNLLGGSAERLNEFEVGVDDPPNRKQMVFIGGAVWAMVMGDGNTGWITREEWDEVERSGPTPQAKATALDVLLEGKQRVLASALSSALDRAGKKGRY